MSYCGTCGTFYSPECPHRASGGCSPAVNPYEAKLAIFEAETLLAKFTAKLAEYIDTDNDARRRMYTGLCSALVKRIAQLRKEANV